MKTHKPDQCEVVWGEYETTNSSITCPNCSAESNVVEWHWSGMPTEQGYQTLNTCPICNYDFVEEIN